MRFYEFSNFRIDEQERVLYRDDVPVALAPKVFDTLFALASRAGRVVSKDILMEEIWENTFVEENNLTQYIFTLRRILDEKKTGAKYIETVSRRGYRFVPEVRVVEIEEEVWSSGFKQSPAENYFRPESYRQAEKESFPASARNSNQAANGNSQSPNGLPEITSGIFPIAETRNNSAAPPKSSHLAFWLLGVVPLGFVLAVIILIAASGKGFLNFQNKNAAAKSAAQNQIEFKRLTPDTNIWTPAISPDGKYVAYVKSERQSEEIWLKDLATGSTVQIMPTVPAKMGYRHLVFAPDGRQLYYNMNLPDAPNATLFRIPIFGGKPQEIAKDVISPPAVAPDGRQVAFVGSGSGYGLIIVNADGSGAARNLFNFADKPNEWFVGWGSQMAWSADGSRIVVCAKRIENGVEKPQLLEIFIADGAARRLPIADWKFVGSAAQMADGENLLVTASESDYMPSQIWQLSIRSGAVRRVTNDFNDYSWISLSADSQLLVSQQSAARNNLWTADFPSGENLRQLTFGRNASDGYYGLAFAPNEEIIYAGSRSGKIDLWAMSADGGNERQLTENVGDANISPRVAPDGKHIFFVSTRAGTRHLWRMDSDGRDQTQLTDGTGEERISLAPDGRWIYYRAAGSDAASTIYKIPADGGVPVRLTNDVPAWSVSVSPDGKLFASTVYVNGAAQPWKVGIFSTDGGDSLKVFDPEPSERGIFRWTADSKSLVYAKQSIGEFWRQPIDGGKPTKIFGFGSDRIMNFDFTPDFRRVVFTRGADTQEAVLIINFSMAE